mmetsp:Transcript_14149/g.41511  ORF Transcript_14149/g.41511 Transcript_14149/m.41511 type:complete len:220 (+) Transcript_14149:1116-1775(+)
MNSWTPAGAGRTRRGSSRRFRPLRRRPAPWAEAEVPPTRTRSGRQAAAPRDRRLPALAVRLNARIITAAMVAPSTTDRSTTAPMPTPSCASRSAARQRSPSPRSAPRAYPGRSSTCLRPLLLWPPRRTRRIPRAAGKAWAPRSSPTPSALRRWSLAAVDSRNPARERRSATSTMPSRSRPRPCLNTFSAASAPASSRTPCLFLGIRKAGPPARPASAMD